jgi:hypothetical protein
MNDKIIDEAMGRVRSNGEFEYDGQGGFSYRTDRSRYQPRQVINEQYPSQPVRQNVQQYPQQDSVMARLDAMEREMRALKEENQALKSRYEMLK